MEMSAVGQSHSMLDAQERVSGRINYALNVELPGMLVRKNLAQPFPARSNRGAGHDARRPARGSRRGADPRRFRLDLRLFRQVRANLSRPVGRRVGQSSLCRRSGGGRGGGERGCRRGGASRLFASITKNCPRSSMKRKRSSPARRWSMIPGPSSSRRSAS